MHEQEIRQIAEFRGITFEAAAMAACDGFTAAIGLNDVVCRYRDGKFRACRVIEDEGLIDAFYEAINATLATY
jgi:hypothetical protein